MLIGIAVFAFVLVVGKLTQWRVHSHVCDTHLIILPTPDEDKEVGTSIFRLAAALFRTESIVTFFMFWRQKNGDEATVERRMTAGPVPVQPAFKAVATMRRWAESIGTTYRVTLFGRRVVVTSAPALARRVLHTHYKLYAKDPVNDANTQIPPGLKWFMPHAERALATRPDMKDRSGHAASRISYAQALLKTAYDAPGLRAAAVAAIRPLAAQSVRRVDLGDIRKATVGVSIAVLLGEDVLAAAFPQAVDLVAFTGDALAVHEELLAEAERPWLAYLMKVRPARRALRSRFIAATRRAADAVLRSALDKSAENNGGAGHGRAVPPLVAFAASQLPSDLAALPSATAIANVKRAVSDSVAGELATAAIKAAGPTATAVAWALHYLALPQNHALLANVRAEAGTLPAPPSPAPASEQQQQPPHEAGAAEVVREVLRLHPPLPVVTRVALHDDMVAVSDIDVANEKLNHAAAAQMDGSGLNRGSFTQRSGCVMLPSSSVIAINLDALLKRTDVFGSDAADFNPRRFTPHRAGEGQRLGDAGGDKSAALPLWFLSGGFGIGARGCPAAHWAVPVASELVRCAVAQLTLTHPAGKQRDPRNWHLMAERYPSSGSASEGRPTLHTGSSRGGAANAA